MSDSFTIINSCWMWHSKSQGSRIRYESDCCKKNLNKKKIKAFVKWQLKLDQFVILQRFVNVLLISLRNNKFKTSKLSLYGTDRKIILAFTTIHTYIIYTLKRLYSYDVYVSIRITNQRLLHYLWYRNLCEEICITNNLLERSP